MSGTFNSATAGDLRRRSPTRWKLLTVAVMLTLSPLVGNIPASAAGLSCASTTVKHGSYNYCPGSIINLQAGSYPAGTRITMNVFVFSASGKIRTVGQPIPCPPGKYCGAILKWATTNVDFTGLTSAPAVYYYTEVWGISLGTTLKPVGYKLGAFGGDPALW